MEHKAFTTRYTGITREVKTEVGVYSVTPGDNTVPHVFEKFQAIWDTGATNTAIASSVVKNLNLNPISFTTVDTGGGRVNAPVHLINLILPNRVVITGLKVTELPDLNNCDLLIGMDLIVQGDFALTHVGSKTCFSFRMPSYRTLDFIPESNIHNIRLSSLVNKGKKSKSKRRKKKKR